MSARIRLAALSLQAYGLLDAAWTRPFGGAEFQVVSLLRALARLDDFEPHLVCLGPNPGKVHERDGVLIHPLAPRRWLGKARTAPDALRALAGIRPQIVLQRARGYETGIAAWYAKHRPAAVVHMLAHDSDVLPPKGWAAWHPMSVMYRFGLRRANRIYAQHGGQQAGLRDQHGLESDIVGSMHHVPPMPGAPGVELLWVGRCVDWKRPMAFLRLVEQLPYVSARMVCPRAHEPRLFTDVLARARALPNLAFHDGLPFEQAEALFAQARVYVLTSSIEGFPNTLVQACKYGVPVVSLSVNPDDVITRHGLGAYTHGDEQALLQATRELVEDDALHEARRQDAYQYAVKHHDITRIVARLADDFRALAQQP